MYRTCSDVALPDGAEMRYCCFPLNVSNFTMIPRPPIVGSFALAVALIAVGCGPGSPSDDLQSAVIDPPEQCSPDRPDCSVSSDFPDASDLTAENSQGLRFSSESGALVLDRLTTLPDSDGDGVPDDADDCPGTPDWITCDDDPTNDGIYATVFYDPTGGSESVQRQVFTTVADIPQIDVYFLVDATPTLTDEIEALNVELQTIVDAVRLEFDDVRFGVGLYRAYPLSPLGAPYSQAPYHHVLDMTDSDTLLATAVGTLDTVANGTAPTAATQALYSMASGLGLGDAVPNRGSCTGDGDIGYPCFRPDSLHVVVNITDSEVYNGPRGLGPAYGDPPFGPGVGVGGTTLPPAEMFPDLFFADNAASRLDLGDLSGRSLTLLGMSNLLTDVVKTELAPGCAPPPPPPPPDPPVEPPPEPAGEDMDGKDVVLALRFDAPVSSVNVFANNTHWPGANVALFDDALLDPTAALGCDGGDLGVGMWGNITWTPVAAQQYYLVIDGIIPAADPDFEPEGAFSISIVHDGDPANPTWLTTDAPVAWSEVETALLASNVRVASVVTLRDAMAGVSDGAADAELLATATDALTATNAPWVTELLTSDGTGLGGAVRDTLLLASTDSVYDISVVELDTEGTPVDEREFVSQIAWDYCATDDDDLFQCGWGFQNRCRRCELDAVVDYAVSLANRTVAPTSVSQVYDFEVVVRADDTVEIERVPVRVMVPDADAHAFNTPSNPSYYRNSYDTTARCITPPERPKWGLLTWSGSTPPGTAIEFQIRTANTEAELDAVAPAIVEIPTDTTASSFDIREELIADGQLYGLPYLRVTAVLKPSITPPATPTLEGWTFEFFCEAAE